MRVNQGPMMEIRVELRAVKLGVVEAEASR